MARRRPQICKVDSNHGEIVNHLRKLGWSVTSLAKVGSGAPDLVVGVDGVNVLLELKMPGEKLNDFEKAWHESWRGRVYVVHSVSEAVDVCADVVSEVMKNMRLSWETPKPVVQPVRKVMVRNRLVEVVQFPGKKHVG